MMSLKRYLVLWSITVLLFAGVVTAYAQDATSEATAAATVEATATAPANQPAPAAPVIDWQTLITGILAMVVVLNQYTNGGVVKTVAGIFKVSQEQAQEWYDRGVKAGIQQQLIAALKTPEKDDDEKAYRLARDAGYKVVLLEDGTPALSKVAAG